MLENVLSLIGNTPLVRITRLNPNPKVEIYAKLEAFNPGGSIKDRVAISMIERAEKTGELTKDKIVIEATSGNTGIGLSMVCAIKGYKLMLLMPESASEERKRIMRAYGAEIFLTPGHLGTDGAIEEAYRLAREYPQKYVLMDQFNNPASIEAHYMGTAMEIWNQTKGKVTHIISALGTTGTAMGIAKRFKELDSFVKVIGVEPYIGHKIQGLKNMQESYPPGIFNRELLHKIVRVDDDEAFYLCRELAQKEGIFAGMSSGAALAGAIKLAKELEEGLIVVIFPDGGERYLSTPLFEPVKKHGIKLFNLATRRKEILDLDLEKVCIFTPGPSLGELYSLEHWRKLIFIDVLSRYLSSKGIDVVPVLGVADLDDQAVNSAQEKGVFLEDFSMDLVEQTKEIMNLLKIDGFVLSPASHNKEFALELCQLLVDKGMAYEKLRSVYFDVLRDGEYGKLIKTDFSKVNIGKTVNLDNYVKEHPHDFTLLKRASLMNLKRGDFWSTKWGSVRPSWYLQMASCVQSYISHLSVVVATPSYYFPHLENLNAIWSKAKSVHPKLWILVQTVMFQDGLMKNLKDVFQICDNPYIIRLWFLSNHYRKGLMFSSDSLKMWESNYRKIQQAISNLKMVACLDIVHKYEDKEFQQMVFDLKRGFWESIEDDFSLHKFWPYLFKFCKKVNQKFNNKEISSKDAKDAFEKLMTMNKILKLINIETLPLSLEELEADIKDIVLEREEAKRKKDFARCDQLREKINQMGYQIQDTPYGPLISKA